MNVDYNIISRLRTLFSGRIKHFKNTCVSPYSLKIVLFAVFRGMELNTVDFKEKCDEYQQLRKILGIYDLNEHFYSRLLLNSIRDNLSKNIGVFSAISSKYMLTNEYKHLICDFGIVAYRHNNKNKKIKIR